MCMLSCLPDRYKVYILDTFTVFFFIKDSCLFFGFLSCRSFPVRYTLEGSMDQRQLRRELGKSSVVWGDVATFVVCCFVGVASFVSFRSFVSLRYDMENSMGQSGPRRERKMSGSFRRPIESKRKAEAAHVHVQFQLVVYPVGLCVHSSLAVRLCVSWLKTAGSNDVVFRPEECFQAGRALTSGVVADDEVEFAEAGGEDPFCTSEVNDLFFFLRGSPSLALP